MRKLGPSTTNILVLTVAMLGIGCLGAYFYLSDGLSKRYGVLQFEQSMLEYQNKLEQFKFALKRVATSTCIETFPAGGWCTYSKDTMPTAALIGDSHAQHFFPGLAKSFDRVNHNLALLGNAGCPPVLDIHSLDGRSADWCANNGNAFIRNVATNNNIKIVIMAANWHLYVVGKRFADKSKTSPYWKIRSTSNDATGDSQAVLLRQLERTIELLLKHKKEIFFLKQVPELDLDPRSCIKRPRSFTFSVDCQVARRRIDAYTTAYFGVVKQVLSKYPAVRIIDLVPQLCDEHFCPVFIEERALYRDLVHLSLFGSYYLGDWLTKSIFLDEIQSKYR
ncbi:MAG: SGNH hydrolase domain-containing protein [Pseudomonadota bacterium]